MIRSFACLAGLAILSGAVAQAQDPQSPVVQGAAAAQQAHERDLAAIVSIKVQIVLSKYQGEKKVSSLPYDLTVRTDGSASTIRMGTQVPVPAFGGQTAPSDGSGNAPTRIGPFTYKDVGTNIDCRATNLDSGRFSVTLTIEDSSVYKDEQSPSQVAGVPAFRSFRTMNSLVLKDGQSSQFTAAADKVSGEVIKADVTIAVVK
jgi:hypothetical protein